MKHSATYYVLSLFILVLLSSCSTARYPGRDYPDDRYPLPRRDRDWEAKERDRDKDRDWEERDRDRDRDRDREHRRENGRSYPLSALGVPKGHLPPPGECKVWFPGRPPGHQPPPQPCASALRSAPLGAWVITHEGSRYKVNIFNRNKRNVIDEVRYYLTE